MESINKKIMSIFTTAKILGHDSEQVQEQITELNELIEFEISKAKEKVVDTFRDLPSECAYEYDEIKFCPSRLGGHNRCKECFSADNI